MQVHRRGHGRLQHHVGLQRWGVHLLAPAGTFLCYPGCIKNAKRSKLGDDVLGGLIRIVGAGRKLKLGEWPESFWNTCASIWLNLSQRRLDVVVPHEEAAAPLTGSPVDSDEDE